MSQKLIKAGMCSCVALLVLGGCSTKRQPQAAIPVSSTAGLSSLPGVVESSGTAAEDTVVPAEERLDYERVVVPPLQPGTEVSEPAPAKDAQAQAPAPSAPPRNPRPAGAPAGRTTDPENTAGQEAPRASDVRAPALRPMISDTDRRQLDGQIQGNLDRFRKNLALIRAARLGTNERNALEEARSFAVRAEQLKGSDPLLANSLAERAAILTQEILRKQ